mmetsp:Transcript_19562/g.46440  ORF Transcript_19562/g.46440 Transcript_19562/m.46440 type:complete len:210 (+) Transcript_19562:2352-2981(+)
MERSAPTTTTSPPETTQWRLTGSPTLAPWACTSPTAGLTRWGTSTPTAPARRMQSTSSRCPQSLPRMVTARAAATASAPSASAPSCSRTTSTTSIWRSTSFTLQWTGISRSEIRCSCRCRDGTTMTQSSRERTSTSSISQRTSFRLLASQALPSRRRSKRMRRSVAGSTAASWARLPSAAPRTTWWWLPFPRALSRRQPAASTASATTE